MIIIAILRSNTFSTAFDSSSSAVNISATRFFTEREAEQYLCIRLFYSLPISRGPPLVDISQLEKLLDLNTNCYR